MEDQRLIEIRKEYNLKRNIYNEFCESLLFLLKKLLINNGFQFQMVSARVKEEESLIKKLSTNEIVSNINSIIDLDDMAGTRVIFYLDNEIQKFVRYIYEEFEVVKNNLRYSQDGYNAQHLIIKFKEERLNLTEYAQFKGMKCELQLTTVLYHAWSEVSHNITYKSPQELVFFDKEKMDFFQTELKTIMKDYIKPANFKFEFINTEYLELLKGNEIFQSAFYDGILLSNNLSEIYMKLSLLAKYIKKYGDKTPSGYKLIDFIKEVLSHSQRLGIDGESPAFLDYGNDYSFVVTQCLEILDIVKYRYTDQVFLIFIDLALHTNENIRKQGLNSIKKLTKYKLGVMREFGLQLQFYIMEQIKEWGNDERLERREIINCVLFEIFHLEYEFTENIDYKTVGFGNGILPVGEELKQLRKQSMDILINMFSLEKETPRKIKILDVLDEATKNSFNKQLSDELKELVIMNTISLMEWYITLVKERVPLEIIKKIDEQTTWLQRRFPNSLEGLSELTTLINENDRYAIYKDLVGYSLNYLVEMDWRSSEAIRNEKIDNYVSNIAEENKSFWIELIVDICTGSKFNEQGQYKYFNKFLFDISKRNPKFAKELIFCLENDYEIFLHHVIAGLRISDRDYTQQLLEKWINEERNLLSCVRSLWYEEEIEISILNRLFEKASNVNENVVLGEIVSILTTPKINKYNSTSLFVKSINELSRKEIFWWTNYIWSGEGSILSYLNNEEQDQLIDSLTNCPRIEYHAEEILNSIAINKPLEVVQFFKKRLLNYDEMKKINPRYEAIPFQLIKLNETLKEQSEIIIPEIIDWFKSDDWLVRYEASDLLYKIFPLFDEPLESSLRKLLIAKDVVEAEVVLEILEKYNGDSSIFPFCQEFVISYQDNKDILTKLMNVLSKIGVVTGEYGFVIALKNTKSLIKKWNKSKSEPLRNFAKDFSDSLNARIIHETKRSDENVQLMQYLYGKNSE